jgi:glycerophosphoryl diester phosphodiesterase
LPDFGIQCRLTPKYNLTCKDTDIPHCTAIHGHRGARGIAPENTLGGFSVAMGVGVNALELDVNVSSDHRLVIHHDSRLNPAHTRDFTGNWLDQPGPFLFRTSLKQLSYFDVGRLRPESDESLNFPHQIGIDRQYIPTLADVADLLRDFRADNIILNIEVKCDPTSINQSPTSADFAALLVRELDTFGLLNRTWVQSFNWCFLQQLQLLKPVIPTGYLTSEQSEFNTVERVFSEPSPWLAGFDPKLFNFSLPKAIRAAGGSYWGPDFRDLSEAQVQEAHECFLGVYTWTVNDEKDIARLCKWHVDGVTTDYPDVARQVLAQAGCALPRRYLPLHPIE